MTHTNNTTGPEPIGWLIKFIDASGAARKVYSEHNFVGDYRDFDPSATSIPLYLAQPRSDEAAQVCAEAYIAVCSMLADLEKFNTPEAQRLLDNLATAELIHTDILPWPRYSTLRDELKMWRKLQDPTILHANLLWGLPAKLTSGQLQHLLCSDDTQNTNMNEVLL